MVDTVTFNHINGDLNAQFEEMRGDGGSPTNWAASASESASSPGASESATGGPEHEVNEKTDSTVSCLPKDLNFRASWSPQIVIEALLTQEASAPLVMNK